MFDPMTGCPDAPLEPPEDDSPVIGVCCICGHEIRDWEAHFAPYGDLLCGDSSCGQSVFRAVPGDRVIENHEQWLQERLNGIGASEASAIVGMNPYMTNRGGR